MVYKIVRTWVETRLCSHSSFSSTFAVKGATPEKVCCSYCQIWILPTLTKLLL